MACFEGKCGYGHLSFGRQNISSKQIAFRKNCGNVLPQGKEEPIDKTIQKKRQWRGLLAHDTNSATAFKIHILFIACKYLEYIQFFLAVKHKV